jgi:hypothetical protein
VQAAGAKLLGGHPPSGSVSASPIPESNVIQVAASSPTAAGALALAGAGAKALVADINKLNLADAATIHSLYTQYARVEADLLTVTTESDTTRGNIQRLSALAHPTAADRAQYTRLEAQLVAQQTRIAGDNLQASALLNQYQAQYSPDTADADTVTISDAGSPAGSDKKSFLEIGVIGGLFGGALVGLAVAAIIDLRRPATTDAPPDEA